PAVAATATPAAGRASPAPAADPFDLLSRASLFLTLEDLTAIQPYSGWRTSSSEGEREAMDYVAGRLDGLGYVKSLGLEVERQSFRVAIGQEMWDSRLEIRVGGQEKSV